jgi:dimethylaniline monooxygenase (N-oxide forming)
MNGMADLIGCQVHLSDFAMRPWLLFKVYCGSNVPVTYRLKGPHSQRELAEEVILRLPVAHGRWELLLLTVGVVLDKASSALDRCRNILAHRSAATS